MNKKLLLILLAFIYITGSGFHLVSTDNRVNDSKDHARNIILMIGDGMGLAQIYAAYTINKGSLNMFRCPYTGICKTNSADQYVTDSGAGATAFSTGKKTKNKSLAVDSSGKALPTILEIAERNGLSTGVVVTSAVTHATPAAFVAHCTNRDSGEWIALDFLKSDIDVFIGGGKKYFVNRKDKRDITENLRKNGFKVAFDMAEIAKVTSGKLAGLIADDGCPAISKGRGNMLSAASDKAIQILNSNPKGFFLMIEGSQIDWGAAKNNIQFVTEEVLDFDKVVGKVIDFATHEKNTLVIIIADHETGGLAVTGGNFKTGQLDSRFSTTEHTGVPVMVFAFGPGAEKFTGFYENTDVFQKMMNIYGFSNDSTIK
jgi:alkaline phosphatase